MTDWHLLQFELVKLVLQLIGAGVLARLTVYWALRRYKSEKSWERRLSAYSDVVAALGDMRRVLGLWEDEEIESRKYSEDFSAKLQERYQTAKRRIEDVAATAKLILPAATATTLDEFLRDISSNDADSWIDQIEHEWKLIKTTEEKVLEQGRSALGTEIKR